MDDRLARQTRPKAVRYKPRAVQGGPRKMISPSPPRMMKGDIFMRVKLRADTG